MGDEEKIRKAFEKRKVLSVPQLEVMININPDIIRRELNSMMKWGEVKQKQKKEVIYWAMSD